jgi:hypothetical protein
LGVWELATVVEAVVVADTAGIVGAVVVDIPVEAEVVVDTAVGKVRIAAA